MKCTHQRNQLTYQDDNDVCLLCVVYTEPLGQTENTSQNLRFSCFTVHVALLITLFVIRAL